MIVHILLFSQTICAQLLNRFFELEKYYGFTELTIFSNEFKKN